MQKLHHWPYRIKANVLGLLTGKQIQDDFDWRVYTHDYRGELIGVEKESTIKPKTGDYEFRGGKLIKIRDVKPMHANHHILCEAIGEIGPSLVLEIGCGGGDHLHNLSVLLRGIRLQGSGLSEKRLELARQRHPQLKAELGQFDATSTESPAVLEQVDLVYTQAVIMHIQRPEAYMQALRNVFRLAKRQVALMENWSRHDFMADIKNLITKGEVPWKEVRFYCKRSEMLRTPRLMIVSAERLEGLPELTDYSVLK